MLRPVLDKPPFKVSETGWGEFQVPLRIQFVQEASEKPLTVTISIKLHHWGPPIEPILPPPSTTNMIASTPTPTSVNVSSPAPKTEPIEEKSDVSMENIMAIPPGATVQEGKDDDIDGETQETVVAVRPDRPIQNPALPISIASKYPVHAWQYDELIFSDPPLAFYNILNEHPPTPLPSKNRRPRDQREEFNKTKKKGRMSNIVASATSSRAGTPTTDQVGRESVPPAVAHLGIPGEPGSADVPLEFTTEMEKGEWNKLHESKKQVIEQMDKWRLVLSPFCPGRC